MPLPQPIYYHIEYKIFVLQEVQIVGRTTIFRYANSTFYVENMGICKSANYAMCPVFFFFLCVSFAQIQGPTLL